MCLQQWRNSEDRSSRASGALLGTVPSMSFRKVITALSVLLMATALALVWFVPTQQESLGAADKLTKTQLLKLQSDINDCERATAPSDCVDNLLNFLPDEPVTRYLFLADTFPDVGDCHTTAHFYGIRAQIAGSDMPERNDLCEYGFVHGYLLKELAAVGLEKVLIDVTNWCGAMSNDPCWHGVGHGLGSVVDRYTPDELFDSCASLDAAIQISCARGLAMELGLNTPFGYQNCAALSAPFDFVCDSEVGLIAGEGGGEQGTASCLETRRPGCAFGLGRGVTMANEGDAEVALATCRLFSGDALRLCASGSLAVDNEYLSGSGDIQSRCKELYDEMTCQKLPEFFAVQSTGRIDAPVDAANAPVRNEG